MPIVLLVEDHIWLGQVLSRLLRERENIEVWAHVRTAEAALDVLFARPAGVSLPDVVLVDIALPDMSGIALVAELKRRYPALPCLMLSGQIESHLIRRSLAVGARGYIAKEDAAILGEAVRRVLGGETFLSDTFRIALAN